MREHLDRARTERAGLRAAIGRVERSLAAPGAGRVIPWAKELAGELDELEAALEQHITTTEAPEGLLADIASQVPRLAHKVQGVRDDHGTLRQLLAAARAALPEEDDGVAASRDRCVELLTACVRHRHVGADLVYEACNVDLEAMD